MENVAGALNHTAVPQDWHPAIIRDWDVGGLTYRRRSFWTWPFVMLDTTASAGEPSYSVLASTAKKGGESSYAADKRFLPGNLPLEEYERLQGCAGVTAGMMAAGSSKYFAVHCLGNGVPLPMGRAVARAVKAALKNQDAACVSERETRTQTGFPAEAII